MSAESDFLLSTVQALVSQPESVSVVEIIENKNLELTLLIASVDMSVLIGREGRTAGALRTLCRALGARNGRKTSLKITEPLPS